MERPSYPLAVRNDADLAIVGAGILGLAVAREALARRPGLRVAVLDKQDEVGFHQTGHSSGVIHAGIYYAPGSLKARLCVEGAARMYEFCDARGIRAERCGKLIVALEPECAGVAALHSPATGIVDFAAVARALADDVREAGGELVLGREVRGL